MRGEGGGGVAGSQPMNTAVHWSPKEINFRNLTPYLTYGFGLSESGSRLLLNPDPILPQIQTKALIFFLQFKIYFDQKPLAMCSLTPTRGGAIHFLINSILFFFILACLDPDL